MSREHEDDKDQEWNISNDSCYEPRPGLISARLNLLSWKYGEKSSSKDDILDQNKSSDTEGYCESNPILKHSRLATTLNRRYYPTYENEQKLINHYRPKLRNLKHGRLSSLGPHGVKSLHRHRQKYMRKLRKQMEQQIKNGATRDDLIRHFHLLTSPESLDPKTGALILFEYSEQFPALMSQIGMASFLKQYIGQGPKPTNIPRLCDDKQLQGINKLESNDPFRVIVPVSANKSQQPFLVPLEANQRIMVLENNLFRAPVFQHRPAKSDFLILRSRNNYYISLMDQLYVVGQQLPLVQVPSPGSNSSKRIDCDFFVSHVLRQLRAANKRFGISIESLERAFPTTKARMMKRRLETIVDIVKAGYHFTEPRFVLKSSVKIPNEIDLRQLCTPEMYCLRHSMLQGLQRLKDLGYENSKLAPDDDRPESVSALEDEVKAAPWNTTKAAVAAYHGKCLLDLSTHSIDPTGPAREALSYVKMPRFTLDLHKQFQEPNSPKPKSNQTGLMSRLNALNSRRHSLPLGKSNDPSDMIRLKKTQAVRERVQQLGKYKSDCQRLFTTQLQVLSSEEPLSSDEDADTCGLSDLSDIRSEQHNDENIDELTKDLNKIINDGKSMEEIEYEKEEQARLALLKSFADKQANGKKKHSDEKITVKSHNGISIDGERHENDFLNSKDVSKDSQMNVHSVPGYGNKILNIYRTFSMGGKEYVRTETVRDPSVIKLYLESQMTRQQQDKFCENSNFDDNLSSVTNVVSTATNLGQPTMNITPNGLGENGTERKLTEFLSKSLPVSTTNDLISNIEGSTSFSSDTMMMPCSPCSPSPLSPCQSPGEQLSRTDGLRLIVSKKVLQGSNIRNLRQRKPINYNYGTP